MYLLKSSTKPGADRLAGETGAAAAGNDRQALLGGELHARHTTSSRVRGSTTPAA